MAHSNKSALLYIFLPSVILLITNIYFSSIAAEGYTRYKQTSQSVHCSVDSGRVLPVAQVKWEYMIFSLSGFKSTNIRRMNSRAAIASRCGPADITVSTLHYERWLDCNFFNRIHKVGSCPESVNFKSRRNNSDVAPTTNPQPHRAMV